MDAVEKDRGIRILAEARAVCDFDETVFVSALNGENVMVCCFFAFLLFYFYLLFRVAAGFIDSFLSPT